VYIEGKDFFLFSNSKPKLLISAPPSAPRTGEKEECSNTIGLIFSPLAKNTSFYLEKGKNNFKGERGFFRKYFGVKV
jgi:hypothetical protein